jgi:toxin ParE1/3/4
VSAAARRWTVRLTATAQSDFQDIVRWTEAQFGPAQAQVYTATLSAALDALAGGPSIVGARARNDVAAGLFTLHVARRGCKGRHFVLFRIGGEPGRELIEVLRLLHDAMDLSLHVPSIDERG